MLPRQLACLFVNGRTPTQVTSSFLFEVSFCRGSALSWIGKPMFLSTVCAPLAASMCPKVSITPRPVDFATLGTVARYCAKKAIGERRSVGVTSDPPAFFNKRIF